MDVENLDELSNKFNKIIAESEEKLSSLQASVDSAKEKEIELNTYNNRIAELKGIAETNNNSVSEALAQANVKREDIDKLYNQVFGLNGTIQTFHDESKNRNDEINLFNANMEESKRKIGEIFIDVEEKLKTIAEILQDAKNKQGEIDSYKKAIDDLKLTIEENGNSITVILNKATEVKNNIDELYNGSKALNEQINSFFQDSKSKTEEIDRFFAVFEELKTKVENPDTGITSTLETVKKIANDISETNKTANTNKENIIADKVKSAELLKESAKLKDGISINFAESEKLKTQIGKILDLVRDTGLANSFDKRRKRSERSLLIWGIIVFIGVGLSWYLIHKIFRGRNLNCVKVNY